MKKREYPPRVIRKKMIKGLFWTSFVVLLFLSIVAIVRVGNVGAGSSPQAFKETAEPRRNLAASEGAQSFAQNFATQYFQWNNTDQGKQERMGRLEPYLAQGIDEQAGLSFQGMKWNSTLQSSQIWNVKPTSSTTATITLRIQHSLQPIQSTSSPALATQSKPPTQSAKPTQPSPFKGPYEKYFAVPVKTDGKGFVVYGVPYFTPSPKKPHLRAETSQETDKITDSRLQEEVETFLQTFFKVYSTGTKNELSYYVKGKDMQTMKGVMTFQKIDDLTIGSGEGKREYQVNVTGVFQEDLSKAQLRYPYSLVIVHEQDRWFVKSIKNQ